jgi:hypothetical protein
MVSIARTGRAACREIDGAVVPRTRLVAASATSPTTALAVGSD